MAVQSKANFDAFLKETHSPEASSSLSSEVDGLDGDIVQGRASTLAVTDVDSLNCTPNIHNSGIWDTEREEETVMQSADSPELQKTGTGQYDKSYGPLPQLGRKKENASNCLPEANDSVAGNLSNSAHAQMTSDDDDDDAICKRTRARYSLASFTLDELEAFLQETDDDDDVQNVDDEEEYRKFLSAVLQGGDSDNLPIKGNGNVDDDDDEDNDADFEVELEEALESDDDDAHMDKNQPEDHPRAARRPETRQNRRQKASVQYEKKLLQQTKRPLRPLIPIPSGPIAPNAAFNQMTWMPHNAQRHLSNTSEEELINGFTPHQIGQLHCLIHEHVQLLIQIFSLCVLDPSRQHIAFQVQGLILEILHKRDEVTMCRNEPHPGICFSPEYVCSSIVKEKRITGPVQCVFESSTFASQEAVSPKKIFLYENIPFPGGTCENAKGRLLSWVPSVRDSILSVLDVAPLKLVGSYIDDVHAAVREYRQRQSKKSFEGQNEKEPLFPFPCISSVSDSDSEAVKASCLPDANLVTQQPSKKTLAAALVERTMKQSIAPVPKDIAQLALRFVPLFNPALFPHKPPPAAVANRVLFTDSEDELLALGLMLCNSDWKGIQERFLPCKSKHQIFVRQKNRCSSKAPENPIKAVRRMKTSPLNPEEIRRIQEGLKVFKLDWMSVWRFIVPYRDPSLLPRQWRIAHGTQKSYKQDAEKKEKRRQYESQRRQKAVELAKWQDASDKEDYQPEYMGGGNYVGDNNMDNEDESYVHEAFLADWRPGTTMLGSSEQRFLNHKDQNLFNNAPLQKGAIREEPTFGESALVKSSAVMQGFPYAGNCSQQASARSHTSNMQANNTNPNVRRGILKSHIYPLPHGVLESNPRIVKLAPDLPPVNLPPSVRVISNSTLKINQFGAYAMVSTSGGGLVDTTMVTPDPHWQLSAGVARALAVDTHRDKSNTVKEKVTDSCAEPGVSKDRSLVGNSDSELQMHPLLFEAPSDDQLSYFPLNSGSSSTGSFSFFSGNQPRLNLSLFHNPRQASSTFDRLSRSCKAQESTSVTCGIDFHPLLQQSDDTNFEPATAPGIAVSEGHSGPPTNFSIHNEASGLDLEIHLSSSMDGLTYSRKQTVSLGSPENANGTRNSSNMSGRNLVSGAHAVASDKNDHISNVENIGDQPHPEIVMEQEELSDSDEEVEEHVEFECEEMSDSEGEEGSSCDQITEASGFMALTGTADMNYQHQQNKLSKPDPSLDNDCFSTKSSPFLKLGLTCQPRKEIDGNSWLRLDSFAEGLPSHSKPRSEGKSEDNAARKKLGNLSHRSIKQTIPGTKGAIMRKHAEEIGEELELGPAVAPKCKKPRKRACQANTALDFRSIESSNHEDS